MKKKFTRHNLLGVLLSITIISLIGVLALSVNSYFDKIIFGIMIVVLIYCIAKDYMEDRPQFLERLFKLYKDTRLLSLALGLYLIWDIVTMLYTKSPYLALRKLPHMLEYLGIFVAGVYYANTTKRLYGVMASVAITGTLVSIATYFYYFLSERPIYFQRLSTARDYNVYACLILVSFIFMSILLMNYSKMKFRYRISLFILICFINFPAFYYAGSRRMAIMIPYFFILAVLFESIRLMLSKKAKTKFLMDNLIFFLVMVSVFVATIYALPTFSDIGKKKEAQYKLSIEAPSKPSIEIKLPQEEIPLIVGEPELKDQNIPHLPEKTISNILETINDKTMTSKRKLIYSVGIQELKTYSLKEIVVGKGSAYDINIFDKTQDKALLEAYEISDENPRPTAWLSVHNFLLADMLNGGIIKVILALVLMFFIIKHIIKAISIKKRSGVVLIIPFTLVFVNNSISGAYGMLNDVFFHIMMVVLFSLIYVSGKETEREELVDGQT